MLFKKNKHGWIRIIEAFISIILILGILMVSLEPGRAVGEETEKIYSMEQSMLKEAQLGGVSREYLFSLPLNSTIEGDLQNKMNQRKLNYMECRGQVCGLNDICEPVEGIAEEFPENDIYVQESAFFSDGTNYGLRKLKLFCWEK